MTRPSLAAALVLLLAPATRAQDMSLTQLLIDGEGWVRRDGPWNHISRGDVIVTTPDRMTEYSWRPGETFLHAKQVTVGPRSPYAPLRPSATGAIRVTELAADKDGRIYAATPVGVQVFDPTGRLCGVIHPPTPAGLDLMWFEGDRLVVAVGGVRYVRQLRTTGAN